MAMIDTAPTAPSGALTFNRLITEPARRIVAWFMERTEAARTARALERLTPEMLDDIGLTESDVAHYRRQSALFY